jgi:hypothetical protein
MGKFVTKTICTINGKQEFRQLIIVDDKTNIDRLQLEIDTGEHAKKEIEIEGVFDEYENSLESKYKGSLNGLIAIMDRVANLEPVAKEKFRDVTPDGELVKEYEFKYQDIRVYAIKMPNGKLILLGGFKNQQKSDFSKFRSLKKQYLDSIQPKKK